MNLTEQLLNFDTAEISDALDACGIEGAILGIKPVLMGVKVAGPVFTVKYLPYEEKPTEFKSAGDYIDEVPANSVIFIDNAGRNDCTTWGDILTQVAVTKNIAGTIVFGAARDVSLIRELNYPLFASHIYMRSGKNRVYKSEQQCKLLVNDITIRPNDFVLADDNGVVLIPTEHAFDVLEKARNIKETEQAIIQSAKAGMTLKEARQLHRYDQPWLKKTEKCT